MDTSDRKADAPSKSRETNPEHMAQSAGMERRQFLKWMGLVGVVTVVGGAAGLRALGNALASWASQQQASAPATELDVIPPTPIATAVARAAVTAVPTSAAREVGKQSSGSSSCIVRCRNGCSYPGRCKRYTDSNGNNRCDWGECM